MRVSKDAVKVKQMPCKDCHKEIWVKTYARKGKEAILCPGCLEARVQQVERTGHGPRR